MQVPNHPNESLSPEQRRLNRLMAANSPDEPLSVEELQRISCLTVGGFGATSVYARAYHQVLRLVVPKVAFPLADVRDTRLGKGGKAVAQERGRPSALALHRKTLARCRLYRGILLAAAQALLTVRKEDRSAFRREQHEQATLARRLERAKAPDLAAELTARRVNESIAHRRRVVQRRVAVKFVTDAFMVDVHALLVSFTKLRGERRDAKIGQIMMALNLGSPEVDAVRKRRIRQRRQDRHTDRTPG
jgi:hypothetical protein